MAPPDVDLVVVFNGEVRASYSKQEARQDAQKAEAQYTRLVNTLAASGLRAVGKRGEKEGHLLVLVWCPPDVLSRLVQTERHSDFLFNLPTSTIPTTIEELDNAPITAAERIRLVHDFITSSEAEGGLGITPGIEPWDLVESVMALHDREFNEAWIRSFRKTGTIMPIHVNKIREHFGDSVALYFEFLACYTRALIIPSIIGFFAHVFLLPYSWSYSILLCLWATAFVEWWRVYERILSVRWGTRGSFRVEKRRAQYRNELQSTKWWHRDLRVAASAPVILGFGLLVSVIVTVLFVFEAFITQIYTGPGAKFISLAPTILFLAFVTPITSMYEKYARSFTAWENHKHKSTHEASLTIKSFAVSALVAYLNMALSAFLYVPFGASIMTKLQTLFHAHDQSLFSVDAVASKGKLNAGRLQDQMYAYAVTNSGVNAFMELGLPYIMRYVDSVWSGQRKMSVGRKKRVGFEDYNSDEGSTVSTPNSPTPGTLSRTPSIVAAQASKEEREFLERVRGEVVLTEYELFADYSEMVTQFGYISLWSAIWPIASVPLFFNNWFENRGDAFKITVHHRRAIPTRTDTIGPWLETLSFLSWLAALTNSALVYLFRPLAHTPHTYEHMHETAFSHEHHHLVFSGDTREILLVALLVAFGASHAHMLVRQLIRHVIERVFWRGSKEVHETEMAERKVKEAFLKKIAVPQDERRSGSRTRMRSSVSSFVFPIPGPTTPDVRVEDVDGHLPPPPMSAVSGMATVQEEGPDEDIEEEDEDDGFWMHDEGLEEIQRSLKDD